MHTLASLGLHLFCMVGVGQYALPRGSGIHQGRPVGSTSFAWQVGTMYIAKEKQMDALQWLTVMSCGSHLSAHKFNIYMYEMFDWLSICESIHLCSKHDGRPGCPRARFGLAAASSDRFKLLQDKLGIDKNFNKIRHDITHLVTYCDVVHIVASFSYIYGIFRFESLSDLLTLFKYIYISIARSYIFRG